MNIKPHEYQLQTVPNGLDIVKMAEYEEANKDTVQVLPLLPDHLLDRKEDYLAIAEWLLKDNFNNWAYLELDIDIDVAKWEEELNGVYDRFVAHPDQPNQLLYESATLHGFSPEHTMYYSKYIDGPPPYPLETDMPYVWTDIADKCPTITNFWQNIFPIEKWNRVRFLRMRSGGYIGIHRDMTLGQSEYWDVFNMEFGVNMSITHPEGCETWFEGYGKVPWKPGKFFLHNISKIHWVNNFTGQDRVHMIPMGFVGNKKEKFAEIVAKSYLRQTNQL